MPFDPSKPFELIQDQKSEPVSKFDPSKPFELVDGPKSAPASQGKTFDPSKPFTLGGKEDEQPASKSTMSPAAQDEVDRIDKRDALKAAEARLETDNSEEARSAYTRANQEYRDITRAVPKDSAVAKYLPAVAAISNAEKRARTAIKDSGGLWEAVKGVYNSVSKTAQSLTPSSILGRAAFKVIEDKQKSGVPLEDIDPETFKTDVLKQSGKEVATGAVGAVHGAGDVLMQIPATAARGLAAVADASGDTQLASELDLSRKDVTSLREKGISEMTKSVGGTAESAEAGRFVGGFAPVGVPGVSEALSGVGSAAKTVGSEVLSGVTGGARKVVGRGIQAAGETGGLITDVASFASDWAKDIPGVKPTMRKVGQIADLAGTASPKVSAMTQYIRRFNPEGSAYARDAFFGKGKDLRAKLGQEIEEQVQQRYDSVVGTVGPDQAAKEAAALRSSLTSEATLKLNYADAYSKVRDSLVRPTASTGEILAKSAGKGGYLLDDMAATGEDLIRAARDEITELQRQSIKLEPSGASRYSKLQSQLQSAIAREKYLIKATDWLDGLRKMPSVQRMQALEGAAGDAIAHATTGAAMGAAMGLSQSEIGDTDIYNKIVGGATYGTALMALARGLQTRSIKNPEPDAGPAKINVDAVVEANTQIANKIADAMDAQAGVKPSAPKSAPEAPAEPSTPEAPVAKESAPATPSTSEPTRVPGVLRPKPFTITNKATVEAYKARKLAERKAARAGTKAAPEEPASVEVPEAPAATPEAAPARKLRTPEQAAAETDAFIKEKFPERQPEPEPTKKTPVTKAEAEEFSKKTFEQPEAPLTKTDKDMIAQVVRSSFKYRKAADARTAAKKFLNSASQYDLGPRAEAYIRDNPKATADDLLKHLELE